jgi:ABC-type Na+ efflux pump permease subunit
MRWLTAPTFLPVLHRELRENSHRAFNYYLRPFAAAAGMTLLWLCVHQVEKRMNAASMGLFLFSCLHTLVLVLIVAIVPAMTADCISEEKRNGTLGLLFLTPLTARGIIIGKSCAHTLRAFMLWLSVLPVLVIPFLLGGVAWFDVATAITMQFCAILLSLAAGMLASALFRKRNAAFGAACAFGVALNFIIAWLFVLAVTFVVFAPGRAVGRGILVRIPFSTMFPFAITGSAGFFGSRPGGGTSGWSAVLSRGSGVMRVEWTRLLCEGALVTVVLMFIVLMIGAWQIQRSWRDKQSRIPVKWSNRFCTPIFLNRFKKQMRRLLDRNPIGWLQQYSWRARTTKWGLCLAFIIIETIAVSVLQNSFDLLDSMTILQIFLLFIVSIMFVFVGVSSFQTEKQSGALELILITPLRVSQIISGRVYGLWKQFLPAYLVIGTCHVAVLLLFVHPWRGLYSPAREVLDSKQLLAYFVIILGFCNLPLFATYFALRVKNMIAAGVLTTVAVYLAPVFGVMVFLGPLLFLAGGTNVKDLSFIAAAIFLGNILFAGLTVFLLHHSLSRRIYSF